MELRKASSKLARERAGYERTNWLSRLKRKPDRVAEGYDFPAGDVNGLNALA